MNKKILIITECFYPEEFKINDIALFWKREGYNVDVLTLNPTYPIGRVFPGYTNSFFSKDKYQGINIFRLYAVTGYKNSLTKKIARYVNFIFMGCIAAIFLGKKYDYIFGFNLGPLTHMLPAVLIRKLYRKPTMIWAQDIWPDSVYAYGFKKTKLLSFLLIKFARFVYTNIDSIAVSSKGAKSVLIPYIKSNMEIYYIPNWADDIDMSVSPAILSNKKLINFTFAGNVGKVQNLENIIKAFCNLPHKYQKKAQFNIIGNGSNLNNLKIIAKEKENVVFHGKKSRDNMAKYYKSSDFLVISLIDKPVFSSTTPAKLQTYIAAKRPILAVLKGDTADIVKVNNLGVLANPSHIESIIKAVIECINMSTTDRNNFVLNNDSLLNKNFNKIEIIKKITRILVNSKSYE